MTDNHRRGVEQHPAPEVGETSVEGILEDATNDQLDALGDIFASEFEKADAAGDHEAAAAYARRLEQVVDERLRRYFERRKRDRGDGRGI